MFLRARVCDTASCLALEPKAKAPGHSRREERRSGEKPHWEIGVNREVISFGNVTSQTSGVVLLTRGLTRLCLRVAGRPYRGKPSDMWALGVVLFTMLYGQFPFYDSIPQELFRKIKAAEYSIPE